MPYIVLEIKPSGKIIEKVQPKAPDYEAIRKVVGGYIEIIPYFSSLLHAGVYYKGGKAYADDEGLLKQKPVNVLASLLWRKACPGGVQDQMILCGDVIFFAKLKQERNNVNK